MSELLEKGHARVNWIRSRMQLLRNIQLLFEQEKPFNNITIGVSLHLEPRLLCYWRPLRLVVQK